MGKGKEKPAQIVCSHCGGKLTFGGASPGMVESMGGMDVAMEMMAAQAGWKPGIAGWICRAHQ